MPKVSVIVATRNNEEHVHESLNSVLTQTFEDFELIVTDCASTDDTLEKINSCDDGRLNVQVASEEIGDVVALNASLARARGDYIAYLGPEDYFLPRKLEQQVEYLDAHPEIGAAFGWASIVNARDLVVPNHPWAVRYASASNVSRFEWLRRFFDSGNCLAHATSMLRRSCYDQIGRYDPRFTQWADFDLWIRLCLHGEIHVLPQELACQRVDQNYYDVTIGAAVDSAGGTTRTYWEASHVLERYLGLNRETYARIFSDDDNTTPERDVNELVCNRAVRAGTLFHATFGINALYRELENSSDERKLKELAQLAGDLDLFNFGEIAELKAQIASLQKQLKQATPPKTVPKPVPKLSYSFTVKK